MTEARRAYNLAGRIVKETHLVFGRTRRDCGNFQFSSERGFDIAVLHALHADAFLLALVDRAGIFLESLEVFISSEKVDGRVRVSIACICEYHQVIAAHDAEPQVVGLLYGFALHGDCLTVLGGAQDASGVRLILGNGHCWTDERKNQ